MQENNFNQLLTLINEIDNFKDFNTIETQLQIVRKKLEKNKEENILKSIKVASKIKEKDLNIEFPRVRFNEYIDVMDAMESLSEALVQSIQKETEITWEGGITSVQIIPRWFEL